MVDLSLIYQLVGFALVDAINPCELAVMVMVLMTILLRNPADRKQILYSGLMFTLAVFILYFLYGFIIIQFFKSFIPATGMIYLYFFKAIGLIAIILGLLNVRDYLNYYPGGVATEMPLSWRPRVRMLIKKITSPKGAFVVGAFVTLFLLPCTMGPYFLFSGTIYNLSSFTALWLLLIYNFIFVLPMLAVTFGIYLGATTIEKVSGWKEQNIRKLHLAEGIILILLGIAMFTGLI